MADITLTTVRSDGSGIVMESRALASLGYEGRLRAAFTVRRPLYGPPDEWRELARLLESGPGDIAGESRARAASGEAHPYRSPTELGETSPTADKNPLHRAAGGAGCPQALERLEYSVHRCRPASQPTGPERPELLTGES